MFTRATQECGGVAPDHDPLHLRIASAVVVLGLLATGLVVVWRDASTQGGPATGGGSATGGHTGRSLAPALATRARPARQAHADGLRLLGQAAVACRTVAYQGMQVVDWWDAAGARTSEVQVWHERDGQMLVQDVAVPGLPRGSAPAEAGPDPDSDADSDFGADLPDAGAVLDMTGGMVALLGANYQVSAAGRGWVDGRPAQVVVVRRGNGRLAARFWLDSATKLPLRREMFDSSERVISEDAFVELKLSAPAAVAAPAAGSRQWSDPMAAAQLAGLRARGWPLPGPLPGNLTLFEASQAVTASGPVVDLSYSDGLSVLSLFVQRGHLPPRMKGWSEVALWGQRVYAAGPDERSVAWSANGFVYTLIADAPEQTIGQVVTALPHGGRPGFFARLVRGLHRLTAWADPFH